ncbi:MAG: DUF4089 domain-containing protein [Cyanobacteria bacterium P01_C01_bin.120]
MSSSDSLPEPLAADLQMYVKQSAALLGLALPDEVFPQVVENFERVAIMAQPVLDFELPDTVEPAAIFEP